MTNPIQDVLVIIPAFRNQRQLDRCIECLKQQTVAHRLAVFIKDNSEDNIYYTAAINQGLRHGLGIGQPFRFFLPLNQDCYLNPDAIEQMLLFMEANPHAGIVGPLQLDADDPARIRWAGSLEAFPAGRHIGGTYTGGLVPTATPWVNGAAMLIRRETLIDTGVMDANMRLLFSDADICFTARTRGWQLYMVPQAICLHERGGVSGKENEAFELIKSTDYVYFGRKWLTGQNYQMLDPGARAIDINALRQSFEAADAS
ncbi:glycosyltransferase [Chitinimonas sp. BJYL2]|uniref:glycosyltransferase n=1 Tax=Chitinimonas sp. BJYL2 TaxID=2976696 RepID=UPI0022B33FF6|nr:glycosyltransferase family 2 protein [Chitinimonas sp. BJYL2]